MIDEQALRKIYSLTEDLENSLRYDQGMMLRKSRAQEVQFIESEPKAQAAAVQAPARLDMASMNLESLKACISDCRQCQRSYICTTLSNAADSASSQKR